MSVMAGARVENDVAESACFSRRRCSSARSRPSPRSGSSTRKWRPVDALVEAGGVGVGGVRRAAGTGSCCLSAGRTAAAIRSRSRYGRLVEVPLLLPVEQPFEEAVTVALRARQIIDPVQARELRGRNRRAASSRAGASSTAMLAARIVRPTPALVAVEGDGERHQAALGSARQACATTGAGAAVWRCAAGGTGPDSRRIKYAPAAPGDPFDQAGSFGQREELAGVDLKLIIQTRLYDAILM
jgi:hypothetical protein